MVHNELTGNAHFFSASEQQVFGMIKDLLSYLPSAWNKPLPRTESKPPKPGRKLAEIVPEDTKKGFDIKEFIARVVDDSSFLEVHKFFAPNIVVGFARLNGNTIGIVANQPKVMAGVLDVDSSDKAARFVRFCDAFNIPLLTLVDIPGYLPGIDQEHAGVIRHGAKLLYAYSEATVPKVTLILRKAFGGGYIAMSSKHLNTDFVYAWPTAQVAVMGPEAACNIIFAGEIAAAKNPETVRKQKIAEYTDKFSNPYKPASKGYIDMVIHPDQTRVRLIMAFDMARTKEAVFMKHKHGCIPL